MLFNVERIFKEDIQRGYSKMIYSDDEYDDAI